MAVMIWDNNTQAFKDAEIPKIWDNNNNVWKNSTGMVYDKSIGVWKTKWGNEINDDPNITYLIKDGIPQIEYKWIQYTLDYKTDEFYSAETKDGLFVINISNSKRDTNNNSYKSEGLLFSPILPVQEDENEEIIIYIEDVNMSYSYENIHYYFGISSGSGSFMLSKDNSNLTITKSTANINATLYKSISRKSYSNTRIGFLRTTTTHDFINVTISFRNLYLERRIPIISEPIPEPDINS